MPNTSENVPHSAHLYVAVPAAAGEGGAVRRHLHGRDPVLVGVEDGDARALQRVPHVDAVVVVAGEEEAPAQRHVHRVAREYDALLLVDAHLGVGAQVEQAALRRGERQTS